MDNSLETLVLVIITALIIALPFIFDPLNIL